MPPSAYRKSPHPSTMSTRSWQPQRRWNRSCSRRWTKRMPRMKKWKRARWMPHSILQKVRQRFLSARHRWKMHRSSWILRWTNLKNRAIRRTNPRTSAALLPRTWSARFWLQKILRCRRAISRTATTILTFSKSEKSMIRPMICPIWCCFTWIPETLATFICLMWQK